MKTRDLIEALQQIDPEGCAECCVSNEDIFDVCREPAYYDGRLQVLKRDAAKKPSYDVVGAAMTPLGTKIVIKTLSIEDALLNDPAMPVDTMGDHHSEQLVASWRRAAMAERHL